ncbi:hypothetical protein NC651_026868 [Populus alba x Populus x berolinensis]|nr:hypothetical protein NC651_026868 [Populus alba x Populus x berolinensis]
MTENLRPTRAEATDVPVQYWMGQSCNSSKVQRPLDWDCSDISLSPFKLFFPFLSSYCLDYFVFMFTDFSIMLRTVVAALASDPNVWNAVLGKQSPSGIAPVTEMQPRNLLQIRNMLQIMSLLEILILRMQQYLQRISQNYLMMKVKLETLKLGLMDVINNVKLTVVDMVDKCICLLQEDFYLFIRRAHNPMLQMKNAGSSTTGKTLAASLMALAVVVIMVVVLRRP